MKKYLFILSLAAIVLSAFTACRQNQETATLLTEPELIELEPTEETSYSQEPDYEYVHNAPTTTVRFYYHSIALDPNAYALPEAFLYNAEEIIGVEGFTDTFRKLMYEHTGLQILDLWFEGSKLYVDLHESAIGFFDHHGTAGGAINATIFEKSILSMPGISSFEVLVNGQRGVMGNHFNFGHVAIVENGAVVRREFFDLPEYEPTQASGEEAETIAAILKDSWQEAYGEILRLYATGQNLREGETGWEFALHDINQDGTPELFLGARQISGHIDYRYVYTFLGGKEMNGAVRLDFEGFLTDGAIFFPTDNSPWVLAFLAAGSGGHYMKLEMIGHGLVPTVEGMAFLNDEGQEMMFTQDDFDWQNYEWYDLSINDETVTTEDFTGVFGTWYERELLELFPINEDNIRSIIFSLPVDGADPTNVSMQTPSHPFATALREYMAGYDGVVRAYLVTLDDDGTIGVLTTRPTTSVLIDYDTGTYAYGPSGMLFYMQDGELFQIDVSGWFFVAGRYNRLMERLCTHTHIIEIIYKLEFGRLEISTRLEYFSDEYLSMLFDNYDIVAEFIAERDALAEYAREKYRLVGLLPPNLGHMRNTADQTAQILAMTINCVPSLTHGSDFRWVAILARVGGGISISIPSTWQSYEHTPLPGGEPFRHLLIYGEGIGGLIELSIHESPISHPSMILDEFTYHAPFQFDGGHIGYMAEDYRGFVWIHDEGGILDIYFRHGGNRELFTNNKYLILDIVRSLRYNP